MHIKWEKNYICGVSKNLVIIPTYNEKENIANIIEVVLNLEENFHILVVDDGSPDGTGEIVDNLIKTHPNRLSILHRKEKNGLGPAYIAGFKVALERGYEYIFEMDADFSHPPADLINLLRNTRDKNFDITVGSRYIKGGGVKNWSWDRHILSRGASFYVQAITWMPVKDPTAGFVCYRAKVLETLDLDKVAFKGYAFQIEMKYTSWKKGFKISEYPITFIDRELGTSKMDMSIVKEGILGVLKMKFRV